ncbi:hypothetical protein Hanom_Chr09g00830551 [Helianthus anomalus]
MSDECEHYESVGRLSCNMEPEMVDVESGEALSPMQRRSMAKRSHDHERYSDEEAGQIPMAYVVRKPGSQIRRHWWRNADLL